MMKAREHYLQGNLTEALSELSSELKQNPADTSLRIFLFELLVFQGEYNRALKQLDIISHYNPLTQLSLYSMNIAAELARLDVFNGRSKPEFFSAPPDFIDLYIKSIGEFKDNNLQKVQELLNQAQELCTYNVWNFVETETSVDFIIDSNDFIGNVLEVFVGDRYFWIPLENILSLKVHQPALLRDLIWITADIECDERYSNVPDRVFLPVLYCNSSTSTDEQVRLGRITVWDEVVDKIMIPKGRKTYLTNENDLSIFDLNIQRLP